METVKTWLKPAAALAAAAALILAASRPGALETLRAALAWMRGLGPWGPAAFIAVYVLATVLLVPGSILTLGVGVLYGVAWGTAWVSLASTAGAAAAFLISRHLARSWAEGLAGRDPRLRALDEAVSAEGWKIVLLARLSPVFPFNLLNYAFGLTKVRLRDYVLASWAGMLPGTALYVYAGSLAGDLASLGAGTRSRTPQEWAFYGVGLAATLALTIYLTRAAKRALGKKL